jgi:hypothetical protein
VAHKGGVHLGSLPKTELPGLGFGSRNAEGGGVCQDRCPEVGEHWSEVVGVCN